MIDQGKINFSQVQLALKQLDDIKTQLTKEGIFHFYQNAEYKKALINYEYLYDFYIEQKEAEL